MRRRDFLVRGVAALPAMGLAAPKFPEAPTDLLAQSQLIWSASTPEVAPAGKPVDLHSVFLKGFAVTGTPRHARLRLFAFNRYRIYVNGKYVGRGPNRFQIERPEYDELDLRDRLREGQNTVAVLVHRDLPTGRIMSHEPGFIAALELADGAGTHVVATDATWLSMPEASFGPRKSAWASIEEHIDARKGLDWATENLKMPNLQVSVVVAEKGAMKFYPRSSPAQRETRREWLAETPLFPLELGVGMDVSLRLSEIAQAYHVLEMDADEGSELEIGFGLPQGAASGRSSYVARAGIQTWMGGDTFAFDRLQLRLKSGRMRILGATAWEVRYPFERVGSFTCSDPYLDKLWHVCVRSLELLSEDAYVDCADRERVEWTDNSPPAFDVTRVTMRGPDEGADGTGTNPVRTHWADARLLRGLLRRIALTQREDGQLKAHSCSERFDIHAIMEDRSCDWVVLLREYLEATGDVDLVRELWPTLERLLEWNRKRLTPRGLVTAREWEVWDNPLRYQVCEGAGLNAMLYRALEDASVMAGALGRPAREMELKGEAEKLRAAFGAALWDAEEGAYAGAVFTPGVALRKELGPTSGERYRATVQGNLFALYSGIIPVERRAGVQQWVLKHRGQVSTPMSHYFLFRMLFEMDSNEQDQAVLTAMRSAWQYQVASEWQTTWEGLGNAKGGGSGSKAHIYGMHPAYFLTAYVLGARREGAASERMVVIEPRFAGLAWAKGVCVTEFGEVPMEWKVDGNGRPEMTFTLPKRVQGRIRLREVAGARIELDGRAVEAVRVRGRMELLVGPGNHRVTFRMG